MVLKWENPFIGANTVEATADDPLKLERRMTAGHNNMCVFTITEIGGGGSSKGSA